MEGGSKLGSACKRTCVEIFRTRRDRRKGSLIVRSPKDVRAWSEGGDSRRGSFAEELLESLKEEVATSMSYMDPEQYVTRDPMKRDGFREGRSEAKDQVRRSEKFVLDLATSERFTKVGLVSVGALLFFYLAIIGAPPSDGRCTLPWC